MKNAIVTGSSRGLGLALAGMLKKKNVNVVITSRKEGGLENALKELDAIEGEGKVFGKTVDFSDRESVHSFLEECMNDLGQVDILINNVGAYFMDEIDGDIEENLKKILEVNLFSAVRMNEAIMPHMKKQGRGLIVHIVSIAAKNLRNDAATYSISKLALKAYNDLLRKKVKGDGIKVVAVYPGSMDTSSWDGVDVDHSKLIQMSDMQQMLDLVMHMSDNTFVEDITLNTLSGI